MRRSPQVAEVLPLLYLRGLSTGDFREALPVLLGKDAVGLSPTNISRLTAAWEEEYQAFRGRDLSGCDYVYVWVDGIHFNIRLEEDRLCTACDEGCRVPHQGSADGVQAARDGATPVASAERARLLPLVRAGVRFVDGLPQARGDTETEARKEAA